MFEELQWRVEHVSQLDYPEFIKEDILDCSIPLENKFETYSSESETESNKEEVIHLNPSVYKKNYPKYSALNHAQHKICIRALLLLEQGKPVASYTEEEKNIITSYNNLRWYIVKENEEFLKFVQEEWNKVSRLRLKSQKNLYFSLAKKKWRQKVVDVQLYDRYYNLQKEIPITITKKCVHVIYEQTLRETGTVGQIDLPIPKVSKNIFYQLQPNLRYEEGIDTKLPSSRDRYAEVLAVTNDCDIVITSSGLKTITDNSGKAWDIPVIVKEHEYNGKNKTIAYVDKPLPSRSPTVLQLNLKTWKTMLKISCCNGPLQNFDRLNSDRIEPRRNESVQKLHWEMVPENNISKPEMDLSSPSQDYAQTENNEQCCDPCEGEISDADSSISVEKSKKCLRNSEVPTTNFKLNGKPIHPDTNNIVDFKYHNVSYKKWRMKVGENNPLLKSEDEHKEIQVLIRTKLDGCEVQQPFCVTPTIILPHLDFQCNYGGSLPTKSEMIREWISLYFRPGSQIAKVRLNGKKKSYERIERKNINQLGNDCLKNYNFSPVHGLEILYNVLSNLVGLNPGNYLIRYVPKQGPFVNLMKSVPSVTIDSLDLHNLYSNKNCKVDETISWCPIDTTLVFPFHAAFGTMPGMFPPRQQIRRNSDVQNRKRKGPPTKKKAKKKKKSKKSKKDVNKT